MANKYAKPKEIVKTIVFDWFWKGNRTPERVKFPNGKETKVQYMRKGKIIFESGESGTYSRYWDNEKTQERRIKIEIEE